MSTIDGDEIQDVTIDGGPVQEITMDGDVVWEAVQVIDDFEDGNANGWSVSGTGTRSIVSGLNGTSFAWEHSGFTEAHLAGPDAVDRGPQPGDIFDFWFEITSDNGNQVINRFEFSAGGTSDSDKYRIEWERNTGDTELSIEKISGGSQELLGVDENFVPNLDQPYRIRTWWNAGDNDISSRAFFPNGNTASDPIGFTDDSSASGSQFTQPGIYLNTNDNNTSRYDEAVIVDTI